VSSVFDIIKRPVVTEKTSSDAMTGRAAFEVSMSANKHQIRTAVEKLFGVSVKSVNTMIMAGKPKRFGRTMGRRSAWKKAIVTLGDGETIEISPIEEPASEE
jgi:large subunit ribosomal protein L23